VRVGAGADEAQQPYRHAQGADGVDIERQDAHRLAGFQRHEEAQRLLAAIELPPLELPDPGVEDARRRRLLVQPVPLLREACEIVGPSQELDHDFSLRRLARSERREVNGSLRGTVCHVAVSFAQTGAGAYRPGGASEARRWGHDRCGIFATRRCWGLE
jgi:hypothetical protein